MRSTERVARRCQLTFVGETIGTGEEIGMDDPDDEQPSRRNALIAMLVVVGLVAAGWFIGDILAGVSKIQDCVMAGRRNCVLFH